jgi:hypothetical protein
MPKVGEKSVESFYVKFLTLLNAIPVSHPPCWEYKCAAAQLTHPKNMFASVKNLTKLLFYKKNKNRERI